MASSTVVVRGNLLRMAGTITLNASEWIWTGNTHANGTLEIAADAKANLIHGNFTTSPIIEHGTETSLNDNIVRKKSKTP
jgi:hypothetical protein